MFLLLACTSAAHALSPQSNHGAIQAVPAPGKVVIDGQISDGEWDTSGEMFVYGVRNLRERYSVRLIAMWDSQNLYLAMKWRDPTPMINNVDAARAPGEGWMADSFQARFITPDYGQIHLTSWYSSKFDTSVCQINYNAPIEEAGKQVFRGPGKILKDATGFEQAFMVETDNRGYVQEMKIPWTLLMKDASKITANLEFGFSGEYFWGGPSGTKWPAVMWSDPINQAVGQRVVLYQSPASWGKMKLLAKGNLPLEVIESFDSKRQGPIPIRVELPANATKFSLAIDDASGKRVRNLVSHQDVSDYLISRAGDKQIIQVSWDGRAEGMWDKERSLFIGDYVAPGKYVARTIAHNGLSVLHEGSFYNPGTPTWHTAEGNGGWLADHSPPLSSGVLPKSNTTNNVRIFLGCQGGETGVGFIGVGKDGLKKWEWVRLGSGAWYIAAGEKHVYFTYGGTGGPGARALGRSNPETGEQVNFGDKSEIVLPGESKGLAWSVKKQLAISLAEGKVLLMDAETGAIQREVQVVKPGMLAFNPQGTEVIGVSDKQFFRLNVDTGDVKTFRLDGVETPAGVAIDSANRLYVTDTSKLSAFRFDTVADGAKPSLTIGEPGGHRAGKWNPQAMNNPSSVSIEEFPDGSTTHIWITEADYSLKRVSVWNAADGKLVRDYLGTTSYMGSGGALSDDVPDLGIYRGTLFKLDYPNYSYTPIERVGGQPDPLPGKYALFGISEGSMGFDNANHFVSDVSGKKVEYYVIGTDVARVLVRRGDHWVVVAAIGSQSRGLDPHTLAPTAGFPPAPNANCSFVWSDLNGDGFQSPDEVQWRDFGKANVFAGGWGYRCFKDLTWYHSGYALKPVRFSVDGAPIYDINKAEQLPGDLGKISGDIQKTMFGYVSGRPSGIADVNNVIHGLHWITGYDEKGTELWTYPNYWIAVHGGFSAPMATPGVIMGAIKTTGITTLPDGKHSLYTIRGNCGQEFLIRDDGMYVGELFTDLRMAPSKLPNDMKLRGVPINDTSLGGECFNGTFVRQSDGVVRLSYGETDVRVARVTGLDGIVDAPTVQINLTQGDIEKARQFVPKKSTGPERKTEYTAVTGKAFDVNALVAATFAEDENPIVVRQGNEEMGRAVIRYDAQNLYLAAQVADRTPMVNKGTLPTEAFKSGDSVNLYIAPLKDYPPTQISGTRVLLANVSGKPVAVVFKPDQGDKPYEFRSPVRTSVFKYVSEESAVKWQYKPAEGQYFVAAAIPWSVLGITAPASGMSFKLDIGLLFGDDTSSRTGQRTQWVDKQTNVINDVPSEAEFFPANWGTIKLR